MSVNNVLLVGHLGAPPERRTTSTGKALCSFRVATKRWGDKAEDRETADWHAVVAWDKTAEHCERYLDTGSQVAVEGRLTTRTWTGPDGKANYRTEVVAHRVSFLGRSARAQAGGQPTKLAGGDGRGRPHGAPTMPDDDIPF